MVNAGIKPIRILRIKDNFIDRAIGYFLPMRAARRYRARAFMALAGGYVGASRTRRGLMQWNPLGYDADSDILPDLPVLRQRSRDLIRNTPLAAGIINTKVTSVIGASLRLNAKLDRAVLNLTEEAADAWERNTEREWSLFWNSKECDAARTLPGDEITQLVYRQVKENGDIFVNLPRKARKGVIYDLKLQLIEADRVCNKNNKPNSETLAGGIERDKHGAPTAYHILKHHPGNFRHRGKQEWDVIPAYGKILGLENVIHVFFPTRPAQSRGVPDLAPVIEPLKQLGRYTDAELMATVISGMFTAFIESESGDPILDVSDTTDETGAKASDDDYKLGYGSIIGLAPGEKVHDSNPNRPNAAFDPFVLSVLRQIGVAIELPFEILIKHFTSSYTAARGAILEAWRYFISERTRLARMFNQVVYKIWMYEAVAIGRIAAPGFFADPIIRNAYLGSQWIGAPRGMIDENKEVEAAKKRVDGGFSTLQSETIQMTGGDWEKNHPQSVKEHKARKEAGLIEDEEDVKPSPQRSEKDEDN